MDPKTFDDTILAAMAQPAGERHDRMAALHGSIHRRYRAALARITPAAAAESLPGSADPRPVYQIIGHIAAWERFGLLAAGDILAGIRQPRMMANFGGYQDTDGSTPAFATIDAFNAYHFEKFREWSWAQMREFAEDMSASIYTLFTHPQLLHAGRLESTQPTRARLPGGTILDNLTMGWGLWLIMLEHPAIEHGDVLAAFGGEE